MSNLTDSKLQTAYELIKAGQNNQAREILIPLVRANPKLADAWFLLGHAVSDPQEKIRCYQKVLQLEPDNQQAQNQLDRLHALKTAPKRKSPVLLFGFAALIVGLSGFGLWWGLNHPLFAPSPASTAPNSATADPPTVTLVASTLSPKSSPTPKSTSRPTITLQPTSTPLPSVTVIPSPTLTFTVTPTPVSSGKSRVSTACVAPNGLGKLTAPFKIENFGKARATVYINGMSQNGNNPVNCQTSVKQGVPVTLELAWGDYEYIILRGTTIRRGTFFINLPTKATMRIFDDKIQIGEFP